MLLEEINQSETFDNELFQEYVNSEEFLMIAEYNDFVQKELYEASFRDAVIKAGGAIKRGFRATRDIILKARKAFNDFFIGGKSLNDVIADAKLPTDKAKELADSSMELLKTKVNTDGSIRKKEVSDVMDQLRAEISRIEKDKTFKRKLEPISKPTNIGDLTLSDLAGNIETGFPSTTKRQFSTQPIQISQIKIVAYPSNGSLLVEANATSGSRKPVVYDPKILFDDVIFHEENNEENISFKASDGETYNINQLDIGGNSVQTTCNCLDFFYRFAYYNNSADALYGKPPPPYQRKTKRPPVNPKKVPGMCKHIIKLSESLKESRMIS